MENGITLYVKEQPSRYPLTEHQAENIGRCLGSEGLAPKWQRPTEEQIAAGEGRTAQQRQEAIDFQQILKRLSALDPEDMAGILAYLDVLALDDLNMSGFNWLRWHFRGLLGDVRYKGVIAALEQSPTDLLAEFAGQLHEHWMWIEDAQSIQERHPRLFPAPSAPTPPATEPEPPAVEPSAKGKGKRRAA
ncbi:MAG TPA: hypothetical protein VKR43_09220 [Bryobacteraceae bacterium]|nr:hypothetical protein [Bryobacteraceae bacterium]